MEIRPYFVFGDLISNLLGGAVVGIVCAALIGESWNPAAAMIVGMILGMVVAIPLQLVSNFFFGAFETMIPMMLTGMAAGMVVSMTSAAQMVTWRQGGLQGAIAGFSVLVFTYLANAVLCGEDRRWQQ